ncbi:MAG: threonine/serine exporter family protein [Clostridiales bacterium]|nr:threonine/serine exporter family protein [Clostridia bacterium]MCR4884259.1 threonine/serine exporter family protein [Clostridiales bacterium]
MIQAVMALVGTIAFAVLFSVPSSLYVACGLCGATGFTVYALMVSLGMTAAVSIFFGTLIVGILARVLAVFLRSPSTEFVITGIFPLVPGAGVYWTSYYLVTGELRKALDSGFEAVKAAIAITLGLVIAFEIPNRVFHRYRRER